MIRAASRLFGALLVTGTVLAGAGAARAFEVTQQIPSSSDTACLDVQAGETANGTPVEAYPCNGGFNEQWSMVGGEVQGIGTNSRGATCLVAAAGTSGAAELYNCNSPKVRTAWILSTSFYTSLAGSPFQCLDSQGIYGSGAQVVVDACTGAPSQTWVVRDILLVQNILGTIDQACVDVRNSAIGNHSPVDAYPCGFGVNERWTYVNGQLQGIGTTKKLSTCLGETSGGRVDLETCNGSTSQQWVMKPRESTGDTTGVAVQNVGSGNCLDSRGNYGNAELSDTGCPSFQALNVSQVWILR